MMSCIKEKYSWYYSSWFSVILLALQKRNTNRSYSKLSYSLLITRNLGEEGRKEKNPSQFLMTLHSAKHNQNTDIKVIQ